MPIVQALISKNGKYGISKFTKKIQSKLMYRPIVSFAESYLSNILKKPLFNVTALQEYVLICCQRQQGGLIDKPDKSVILF